MTVPINGRELLLQEFIQNPAKCRQAIQAIQGKAAIIKQNNSASGVYQAPQNLSNIRHDYVKELAQAIFGTDKKKEAAFMKFLQLKVKKREPLKDPLPGSWAHLFDKIVDPARGMKNIAAKQQSANQKAYNKQSPIILGKWQQQEDIVKQGIDQFNREKAQLNFNQLAAEIDQKPSSVAHFKDLFRNWARNVSNQPGGPRLQELFAIPNFAKEFIAWQDELVQELRNPVQGRPRPELKPQLRLLSNKLVQFANKISAAPEIQKTSIAQLTQLGRVCNPRPALPVGTLSLTQADVNLLSGCNSYDRVAGAFAGLDAAARPQPVTQQDLQQALRNIQPQIQAQNPPAGQQPQQIAQGPANAAEPPANAPPLEAGKKAATNKVQQPKPPATPKSNAFVSFLKNCGNFFVSVLTAPFRLLKWLFTSKKK